ncbi:MAG TPA: hypothetical protein VGQ99_04215 [Tepidisphaeraceae bacterium]|nr:hypothetical protein [Tepidisphaeraceae bacterium]
MISALAARNVVGGALSMTTILHKPAATTESDEFIARPPRLRRALRLLWGALFFLLLGAVISVLIAWALGLWGDPASATIITVAAPQRGRAWTVNLWSTTGSLRLQSLREAQSWSAWQVLGPPDTPMNGDSTNAWCPATADGQQEWLILDYPQAIIPRQVEIHENYIPGAVSRITLFQEDGAEVEVWRGKDPTSVNSNSGISKIHIDTSFKTSRIKIHLDSPKVPGWNEIDAVGLTDQQGNTLWASDVEESSSYASNMISASSAPFPSQLMPDWCPALIPDAKPIGGTGRLEERIFEARGWPMLALWTERSPHARAKARAPAIPEGTSLRGGALPRIVTVSRTSSLSPVLPMRPIWTGLLFNSLFYALFASLAYWLLTKPRRFAVELLRMRRGCCISCGYELDFDFRSGCPECGWRRSGGPHRPA